MPAPRELMGLVDRFERFREAYVSGQYNETQVRRDFLDPCFKLLGWDMDNEAGYAEAYRDVIHEDAIRIGGAVKAPDYCFRIGGTRKFFLEAKKPAVDIRDAVSPAYQLRRYAWSAKLALSVLSDFEEFAIYDCRIKPGKDDPASTARVFYCTFRELPERWDWLASIFSREAVLRGAFDAYAQASKAKRGTAEVDADFLSSMEAWRNDLARNVALRNPRLSQRELNFAVQRILDRIVFLRICEDRGLEDYGRLLALAGGGRIYPRLCQLFTQADTRYNSGLFCFQNEAGRSEPADALTPGIEVDDILLRALLKGLYYPDSPYEFSVLSADILGQVYEQFLGKVIRLTEGHRAVVDEKPEVRKAGGVYYTPTYIAEYIVRETVGKLIEETTGETAGVHPANGGRDPASSTPAGARGSNRPLRTAARALAGVARLRIVDPACGSGSFLICAYQYLLDWHLGFYLANNPAQWARGRRPALVQTARGWRLTIAERKRILLDNVYGVDVDPQAVEVTKLSLLLKVLEGETSQSIAPLFSVFHERALPDLGNNIKCGNSLIGPDFYRQSELALVSNDDKLRLNAFDWHAEFPHIFRRDTPAAELRETATSGWLDYTMPGVPLHGSYTRTGRRREKSAPSGATVGPAWVGGFDAVIGNPPYVRIQTMQATQPAAVGYFSGSYRSARCGNYDLYVIFVERGLGLLNRNGHLGFILPNKFFNAQYGAALRTLIAVGKHARHIVNFGHEQVFGRATTYTCLLFLSKAGRDSCELVKVSNLDRWRLSGAGGRVELKASAFAAGEWNFEVGANARLRVRLLKQGTALGRAAKVFVGLQTSADRVFVLADKSSIEPGLLRPFLTTGGLRAYQPVQPRNWLLFPYEISAGSARLIPPERLKEEFPNAWAYLKCHEEELRARDRGRWNHDRWYAFGRSQNLTEMGGPKLVIQVTAIRPTVILDGQGLCMTGGGAGPFYGVRPTPDSVLPLKFLLGIMNSKVFGWIVRTQSTPLRGGYVKYSKQYIQSVPIPPADGVAQNGLVTLVERVLSLHQLLVAKRTPHEQTVIERQIDAAEVEIDRFVFRLYGLTETEAIAVERECA